MQTLHCLWQRNQVVSASKNSGMEENWKQDLATDNNGNFVRSISNLRLIFTLDENLSLIKYVATSMATRLMRNQQERYRTIWKGHTDCI